EKPLPAQAGVSSPSLTHFPHARVISVATMLPTLVVGRSASMDDTAKTPLASIPDPGAIHRRLGAIQREGRLLRRLLRLSLAARDERQEAVRREEAQTCPAA